MCLPCSKGSDNEPATGKLELSFPAACPMAGVLALCGVGALAVAAMLYARMRGGVMRAAGLLLLARGAWPIRNWPQDEREQLSQTLPPSSSMTVTARIWRAAQGRSDAALQTLRDTQVAATGNTELRIGRTVTRHDARHGWHARVRRPRSASPPTFRRTAMPAPWSSAMARFTMCRRQPNPAKL
jgi:hypothetical protein